jgi:hypothetical protein
MPNRHVFTAEESRRGAQASGKLLRVPQAIHPRRYFIPQELEATRRYLLNYLEPVHLLQIQENLFMPIRLFGPLANAPDPGIMRWGRLDGVTIDIQKCIDRVQYQRTAMQDWTRYGRELNYARKLVDGLWPTLQAAITPTHSED